MRVNFDHMNYEIECMNDLANGNGFIINDVAYSDTDKKIANLEGPRSPLYGTNFNDSNAFNDRYRCECGKYNGAIFEGDYCPSCNSKIEFRDVNILYTGYLNFYPYKLINPLLYRKLQSALSKKILEEIIGSDVRISSNGVIRQYNDDIPVKKGNLKYYNIGLKSFYENFEEIMLYYKHHKRKAKAAQIQELIDKKSILWTNVFPVYSTALRHQNITTESWFFSPIDKVIAPLTAISLELRKCMDIEVPLYL